MLSLQWAQEHRNSHGSVWAFWGGCSVFSIGSPAVCEHRDVSGDLRLSTDRLRAEAAAARVHVRLVLAGDGLCDVELGSLAVGSAGCVLPLKPLAVHRTRACDGFLLSGGFSDDAFASLAAVCRSVLHSRSGFGFFPGFVVGSEVEAGDGAVNAVPRPTRPALRQLGHNPMLLLY